jgi:hypothetical protein
MSPHLRTGLSGKCTLPPAIAMGIILEGKEHPCDRCNMNRSVCLGHSRLDVRAEPPAVKVARVPAWFPVSLVVGAIVWIALALAYVFKWGHE